MRVKINNLNDLNTSKTHTTKYLSHKSFNYLNQHTYAAASELFACAYLLSKGYEVFRNVSSHGPIDIITYKEGETNLIEVKTCTFSIRSDNTVTGMKSRLRENQQGLNIKILYVGPTGSCSFDPEDLEEEVEELVEDYLINNE